MSDDLSLVVKSLLLYDSLVRLKENSVSLEVVFANNSQTDVCQSSSGNLHLSEHKSTLRSLNYTQN